MHNNHYHRATSHLQLNIIIIIIIIINTCRRFERAYSNILSIKQSEKSGLLDLEGEHNTHFRNVGNYIPIDKP